MGVKKFLEVTEAEAEAEDLDSPLLRAQFNMLGKLMTMHNDLFPERDISQFATVFIYPYMKKAVPSTEKLRAWVTEAEELKHDTSGKRLNQKNQHIVKSLVPYVVACSFYIKALQASESADEAWEHLAESRYFLGFLHGRLSIRPAQIMASVNADARHEEDRRIKADVFVWLDSLTSKFKSTEAAARAIVKQQPIAHSTARDYFKEWKNLRSASTP